MSHVFIRMEKMDYLDGQGKYMTINVIIVVTSIRQCLGVHCVYRICIVLFVKAHLVPSLKDGRHIAALLLDPVGHFGQTMVKPLYSYVPHFLYASLFS